VRRVALPPRSCGGRRSPGRTARGLKMLASITSPTPARIIRSRATGYAIGVQHQDLQTTRAWAEPISLRRPEPGKGGAFIITRNFGANESRPARLLTTSATRSPIGTTRASTRRSKPRHQPDRRKGSVNVSIQWITSEIVDRRRKPVYLRRGEQHVWFAARSSTSSSKARSPPSIDRGNHWPPHGRCGGKCERGARSVYGSAVNHVSYTCPDFKKARIVFEGLHLDQMIPKPPRSPCRRQEGRQPTTSRQRPCASFSSCAPAT